MRLIKRTRGGEGAKTELMSAQQAIINSGVVCVLLSKLNKTEDH